VGRGGSSAEIGAKMELRPKEDSRQEYCQDAHSPRFLMLVVNRTELREERLQGQGAKAFF
jgi:hypothetical protein